MWRQRGRVGVRTAAADVEIDVPGDARPGDLVAIRGGEPARVVRSYPGDRYPTQGCEAERLPRRRLRLLAARAEAAAALRDAFRAWDFLEVDAPCLVPSPGLEVHIDAVPAGSGWLTTSPEQQLKRLLAAGLERIYSLGPCFRAGEAGALHNPEFTMLEWYRAWAGWEEIVADAEALVAAVARALGGSTLVPDVRRRAERPGSGAEGGDSAEAEAGPTLDLAPPWERLPVLRALERFAGVTLAGGESAEELARALRAAEIDPGGASAWDDLFYKAFVDRVEPALADLGRPVVLCDWPAELAALARRKPDAPHLVERAELYAGGLELANGFGELTDAPEQRTRLEADQRERARRGRPVYPIDEGFISALEEGIPPSAGMALGFERLLMLVTGTRDIRDVLPFAWDELV